MSCCQSCRPCTNYANCLSFLHDPKSLGQVYSMKIALPCTIYICLKTSSNEQGHISEDQLSAEFLRRVPSSYSAATSHLMNMAKEYWVSQSFNLEMSLGTLDSHNGIRNRKMKKKLSSYCCLGGLFGVLLFTSSMAQ